MKWMEEIGEMEWMKLEADVTQATRTMDELRPEFEVTSEAEDLLLVV